MTQQGSKLVKFLSNLEPTDIWNSSSSWTYSECPTFAPATIAPVIDANVKRNPNPNPNPKPNLNPYHTLNQKPNHYPHSNSLLFEISSPEQLSPEVNVGSPLFQMMMTCSNVFLLVSPCPIPREVMAAEELMNMPDRVNWKSCSVSKDEESKMAAAFREQFEPFDFNDGS